MGSTENEVLLKAADSNGDETLDYEEFLNWLLGKENEWVPIKKAMMSTPDEDACPSKDFGLISFLWGEIEVQTPISFISRYRHRSLWFGYPSPTNPQIPQCPGWDSKGRSFRIFRNGRRCTREATEILQWKCGRHDFTGSRSDQRVERHSASAISW